MRIGDKIIQSFHCAGVTSYEEFTIVAFDENTVSISEVAQENENGPIYRKFDIQTGRCLNDNTTFGASRSIDPPFKMRKNEEA